MNDKTDYLKLAADLLAADKDKLDAALREIRSTAEALKELKWGDDGAKEPQGFEKLLTLAPGVKLVRFHGKDVIKYVARRIGTSGNPNTIFEIEVDKAAKEATAYRNDEALFFIRGVNIGRCNVEKCAISALHTYLSGQRKRNSRRRRALKARKEAAK